MPKKDEIQTINLSSYNAEVYNMPSSMRELNDALRRVHNTSAGPDAVQYQLLKHLPISSVLLLSNIFNKIWIFQSLVRIQQILPITSCICKTMERMINRRLVWYLMRSVFSYLDVARLIIMLDLKRFHP